MQVGWRSRMANYSTSGDWIPFWHDKPVLPFLGKAHPLPAAPAAGIKLTAKRAGT